MKKIYDTHLSKDEMGDSDNSGCLFQRTTGYVSEWICQYGTGIELIDKITSYDEYLESDEMARKRFVFSVSEKQEEDN